MKKYTIGFIVTLLFVPAFMLAAEFRAGDRVSLSVGEQIFGDMYIAGGSVTSASAVNGDLVVGGGTVVISGPVEADVIGGGGNITILSHVGDDVRVGGGTVIVQGRIEDDVIIGGGQVTIGGPGAGGDVIVGGGTVHIEAPIAGNLRVGGGTVYLNASVAGTVSVHADSLTLGPSADIQGDLTYQAPRALKKEAGAVVRGNVRFEEKTRDNDAFGFAKAFFPILIIGKFLMLLASSLVTGLVFRRYGNELVSRASANTFLSLGKGVAVLMLLPSISVFLLFTVVGAPLGIFGIIGFSALILVSWIMAPIFAGSMFYRFALKREHEVSWQTITVGVFLYSILGIIPFLGWLVQCLILLLVLGALVALKLDVAKDWR